MTTDPAVTAAAEALNVHRWKSMGVSSVECECGAILHGETSLTQFPADEVFREHIALAVVDAVAPIIEAEVRAEEAAKAIDAEHLAHQREWSRATFGPGTRLLGVLDHIRKELAEIEADPTDLGEWVDVVILAFDGAWRAGWEPEQIIAAVKAKQARNEARTWPDWRGRSEDEAIEHDRTTDPARIARGTA